MHVCKLIKQILSFINFIPLIYPNICFFIKSKLKFTHLQRMCDNSKNCKLKHYEIIAKPVNIKTLFHVD